MSKLTVLITESSRNFGGQERRLIREAHLLIEAGHSVEIACPREGVLFERAIAAGIPVHHVSMRASLYPPAIAALLRFIIRLKPDIIYCHSGHDSWLSGIAGLLTGTPVVRCRALLTKVRSRSAYILPRRVLACSEAVKTQLTLAGVPERKIFIQYPPIDTGRFSHVDEKAQSIVLQEIGAGGHFPVISCAGEFRPEKRQEDLVRALARLLPEFPSALLVLAGSGRGLERIRGIARDLGIGENVRFLGEREDIPAILSISDIYAFPSDIEPFGMAPVEAMAAGLPVVACRTGGLIEIMEDGKYGILVPVQNPDALASALAGLARDGALRASLSVAGRERASFFSSDKAIERLLGHFQAVVKRR
jgi:glycosyltransferase involved in cell wall biosynthesis